MTVFSPCPKPAPRVKKARKPVKRIPVKRVNVARRKKEWARAYHSKERVEFVKSLPCWKCGACGQSQNAHTVTGGKSRKADYDTIVPLCARCHTAHDLHLYPFNIDGVRGAVRFHALEVELSWQESREACT